MLVAVALLPVVAFLVVLVLFDSFKLVPGRTLVFAVAAGALAALLVWPLHAWLFDITTLTRPMMSRYVAPVTEETLKALFVVYALQRRQIGFLVDAAIVGFAIGTGFALVENFEYLLDLNDPRIWIWIVRGFGTAMLHASTTAIVAVGAKALRDRYQNRRWLALAGPWLVAIALHSLYNHASASLLLATGIPMIVLPLVVVAVFSYSERMTREWVGEGLDLDVQLLQIVKSSAFEATRLGRYLKELRSRFPGPVVADMFCLLQLELELGIRAKGMLMAREVGLDVPVDADLRDRLRERAYLRKEIGATGLLALRPLQVTTDRDHWHDYLLAHAQDSRPAK